MTAAGTSNAVYITATTVTATAIKRATATNAVTKSEKNKIKLENSPNLRIWKYRIKRIWYLNIAIIAVFEEVPKTMKKNGETQIMKVSEYSSLCELIKGCVNEHCSHIEKNI